MQLIALVAQFGNLLDVAYFLSSRNLCIQRLDARRYSLNLGQGGLVRNFRRFKQLGLCTLGLHPLTGLLFKLALLLPRL